MYGALAADALGAGFKYYDEWPSAAGLLRRGAQWTPEEYAALLAEAREGTREAGKGDQVVTLRPAEQSELDTTPWNMTAARAKAWVQQLRREVCGEGPLKEVRSAVVARVQGHFQHASYFERYRGFIKQCVLRAEEDLRQAVFEPTVSRVETRPTHPGLRPSGSPSGGLVRLSEQRLPLADQLEGEGADLVAYLRLGDKVEKTRALVWQRVGLKASIQLHICLWNPWPRPAASRCSCRVCCSLVA